MSAATFEKGALTVYFGEKSGKYPDGNQVVVRGRDTRVAFDTPLVANRLRAELTGTDLVILGHMHEMESKSTLICCAEPPVAQALDIRNNFV